MNLYEEYRQRMEAASTRAELAEVYREACEACYNGADLQPFELEELSNLYVDRCGDNGWNL